MDSLREREARRDILLQNMVNRGDRASFDASMIRIPMATTEYKLTIRKFPEKQIISATLCTVTISRTSQDILLVRRSPNERRRLLLHGNILLCQLKMGRSMS
jgi:hypothetical protein